MTCVNETKLLRQLKRGSTAALSEIIELYTPYVYAIASNVMRPMLTAEDVEEAVSDSFAALWYNRDSVEPGKLKGYLAVVVRNKALSALRSNTLRARLRMIISTLPPTALRMAYWRWSCASLRAKRWTRSASRTARYSSGTISCIRRPRTSPPRSA